MAARVAACAFGLALSACSLAGPAPRTFTAVQAPAAKPGSTAAEAASNACKSATRDKGIKNVLAILSHMRPGAVDADYVACMKTKGYDVAK
jgi:hypothetical protein